MLDAREFQVQQNIPANNCLLAKISRLIDHQGRAYLRILIRLLGLSGWWQDIGADSSETVLRKSIINHLRLT